MAADYRQLVIDKANQYGINPNIALAQIQRESGFNPRAVGGAGERGLAQFTQGTWSDWGSGSFDNAFDPETNLDAWGRYMVYLLGLFGGDYVSALTAYNGGPGHLTNPGKYGPPSYAARAYAQAVYAQAGAVSESTVSPDQISLPSGNPSSLPAWVVLGIVGLVVGIIVLRD
jgi:soluble lytic murein transglycosylase-like protein